MANQIAAGEVVQSPSSVVKELMENSVDAGASYVIVSVKEGGKSLIQVIDDGVGMSPSDAMLAFERHATSKIATVDDLFAINTFGFRGEALASIASVAEVELQTRRDEDELGVKVAINGGTLVTNEATPFSSCGSQFTIRNLFYNIPARKKSLKKDFTETKRVIQEFERVSLCHPRVAFSLYTDDKLLHMLPSTINIRQRISALFGKSVSNYLVELYVDTTVVEIKGYIGKPETAKKRPNVFFFVNGRYFESPYLYKSVQAGFDKLIPEGTMPPFFLYLKVDSQNLDVNVSPTKTTVKFDEEQAIWQILNAAVRESLGKNGIVPMIDFNVSEDSSENGAFSPRKESNFSSLESTPIEMKTVSDYNPFNESFSFTKANSGNIDSFRNSYMSSDSLPNNNFQSRQDFIESFDSGSVEKDIEFDSSSFNQNDGKLGYNDIEHSFNQSNGNFADVSSNFSPNSTVFEHNANNFTDVSSDISSSYFSEKNDNIAQDIQHKSTFKSDNSSFGSGDTYESLIEYENEFTNNSEQSLFAADVEVGNIFIFSQKYAVADISGDLYIFHIKNMERNLNYYKFLTQIEKSSQNERLSQKLLFPIEVSFSKDDRHTLDSCTEQLAHLGFQYEPASENSSMVLFTEVPSDIDPSDTEWFLEEILMSLKYNDSQTYQRTINEQLSLSLSRTLSKRRGYDYNEKEVKYMIELLIKSDNYSYTVDGKQIVVSITATQIAQMLK